MITILLFGACALIWEKRAVSVQNATSMPTGAVQFLKTHQINGYMFNQFAQGGYLIYTLYPQYQVFFDGRAEIYHNSEMRQYAKILESKTKPPNEFANIVENFLNTYHFSFIILPIEAHSPFEATANDRLTSVLFGLPNWTLVYGDDYSVIFVRHDGTNTDVLQKFGKPTITPFQLSPVKNNQWVNAEKEYRDMIDIQKSAIALFGLGETLKNQGKLEEARQSFLESIKINSKYVPVYVSLAQVYVSLQEYGKAKAMIDTGLSLGPDIVSQQKLLQLLSKL